jgi:hypothetical protein
MIIALRPFDRPKDRMVVELFELCRRQLATLKGLKLNSHGRSPWLIRISTGTPKGFNLLIMVIVQGMKQGLHFRCGNKMLPTGKIGKACRRCPALPRLRRLGAHSRKALPNYLRTGRGFTGKNSITFTHGTWEVLQSCPIATNPKGLHPPLCQARDGMTMLEQVL